MTFSGDCWTEISDASGRQLYRDLGRDGRSVNVSGQAPLSVLFGNADNVRVRINGTDYAISPADRRGEMARLTIH
jgi:cytoskeleton protein RodZ